MKYIKTLISSFLGGTCIGLGCIAYLSVENVFLGAFLFAIGLFVICTFGLNLYTGVISYAFQRDKAYAIGLPIVLAGNLFGAWVMAWMAKWTGLEIVIANAENLGLTKMNNGFSHLFVLAMLCNIMIYIAVEGYKSNKHAIGKYLSLFLGVIVFIVCGFEHSIADMFYFTIAGITSRAVVCLIVIAAGNAVGGIIAHNLYNLIGEPSKDDNKEDNSTDEEEWGDFETVDKSRITDMLSGIQGFPSEDIVDEPISNEETVE